MIPIFIGYDPREPVAFHVCVHSIIRRASEPVAITPLCLGTLAKVYQEHHADGSNEFIYSRFLVPFLQNYTGHGIFIDGDMLVKDDIAGLWDLRDPSKAVQVVKHDYKTKAGRKYLGNVNEDYPRKNWSSVMLWNSGHHCNWHLTPENVMTMTGAELHRFSWIPDDRIGDLPLTWNWLETEYHQNSHAKLIHYTLGTPCFAEYRQTDTSIEWVTELQSSLTPLSWQP